MRISLRSRNLVKTDRNSDGPSLSIHRTFQRNVLHRLDTSITERQQTFARAVALVRQVFPAQSPIGVPVNEKCNICERYLPHVISLHTVFLQSKPPIEPTRKFADLLADAGYYMWDRSLCKDGLIILDTAEKVCTMLDSEKMGMLRANILVALGSLLNEIGISERARAVAMFKEILFIRQEHFAKLDRSKTSMSDQLLFSNAWNDMGWMCLESEAYDEAEGHFQQSLALKHKWTELEIPFEYAETLKNLGWVRLAQGRSREAVDLAAHATRLAESAEDMGPDSAATQTLRFAQSWILFNAGQVEEALLLMLKTLQVRLTLFGELDLHTLDCYYAVGTMYQHKGMMEEAE